MDSEGNPVDLPGVEFIKIYTGVNQFNGWLGECSTEVMGVTDLHIEEWLWKNRKKREENNLKNIVHTGSATWKRFAD